MVGHPAVGVVAAQAGAGVSALLLYAGSGLAALRAHQTLGSAVWRLANHVRQTRALTPAPQVTRRIGVGTTGVGVTRVLHYHRGKC